MDWFEVIELLDGSVDDAVAVFVTEPDSTSPEVTVYEPVQVSDAPGAGSSPGS